MIAAALGTVPNDCAAEEVQNRIRKQKILILYSSVGVLLKVPFNSCQNNRSRIYHETEEFFTGQLRLH